MANYTSSDISEQLFQAIDAIVQERLRQLKIDKTIIATITNNDKRRFGCYQVSTDNNIQFNAYSEYTNYNVGEKVYINILDGDYTKQKVITGRYVQENQTSIVLDSDSEKLNNLIDTVKNLLEKQEGGT